MIRILAIALIGAAVGAAAPGSAALAHAPISLDEQEGNQVTVRGILTVKKKGTTKETFWIDDYKLRGIPRAKLINHVGDRMVVTGEFRVVFGELVIYARAIEPAPKRDDLQ